MRTLRIVGCAALLLGIAELPRAAAQQDPMKKAVADLIVILRDPNVDVRRAAAHALKYFQQNEPAIPALIRAMGDDDDIVRDNAVDALALIQPGKVVPLLTQALRNKNHLVRRLSARTLGRVRSFTEEAIPNLILLLKDENMNVRYAASEALRRIFDTRWEF